MSEPLIGNVSDTARWVATYRAWESARPDALFNDPYAARLSGERGRAMTAVMPPQVRNGWPIIVRTKLIDDLVMQCIAEGCDCVANLAAGLDTRPYRLALPATLHWVEADLLGLIEEKQALLADAQPRCQLSRLPVNLADPAARAALLDQLHSLGQRILVITEGLLVYLPDAVVQALSQALSARSAVQWWVFDLASPGLLQMMHRRMGTQLAAAPMQFAPAEGVAYFERGAFKAREIVSLFRAAARMRRLPWPMPLFAMLPDANPRRPGKARWSAVVRLAR